MGRRSEAPRGRALQVGAEANSGLGTRGRAAAILHLRWFRFGGVKGVKKAECALNHSTYELIPLMFRAPSPGKVECGPLRGYSKAYLAYLMAHNESESLQIGDNNIIDWS